MFVWHWRSATSINCGHVSGDTREQAEIALQAYFDKHQIVHLKVANCFLEKVKVGDSYAILHKFG